MKSYNKLIRDKIPEIIEASGKKATIKVLDDETYKCMLDKKLFEELEEYMVDRDVEELADLVEVVYAILEDKGVSITEFEKIRLNKREERGGFEKRLLLVKVDV